MKVSRLTSGVSGSCISLKPTLPPIGSMGRLYIYLHEWLIFMSHRSYGPWLKVLCAWWPLIFKNSVHVFVCCQAAFSNAAPIFGQERITFSIAAGTQFKPQQQTSSKSKQAYRFCTAQRYMICCIKYPKDTRIHVWYIDLHLVGFERNHHTIDPMGSILETREITSWIFWWHGNPHNKPRGQVSKVKNKRSCLVYTLA